MECGRIVLFCNTHYLNEHAVVRGKAKTIVVNVRKLVLVYQNVIYKSNKL